MGKKGVPDWLNSSLWSSHAPDDRIARYAIETRRPELLPPAPEPPPPPPTSLPPPPYSEKDPELESGSYGDDPKPDALSPEEASRQSQLIMEVSKKVINVGELQRLVCQGIPDGTEIRSTIWKLLLRYLPYDRTLWVHELDRKRSQYKAFKDELLLNPSEITRRMDKSEAIRSEDVNCGGKGQLPRSEITHGEHPLSLGATRVWNKFFQLKFCGAIQSKGCVIQGFLHPVNEPTNLTLIGELASGPLYSSKPRSRIHHSSHSLIPLGLELLTIQAQHIHA